MELLVTNQDSEPLTRRNTHAVDRPLGFLNSNYQKIVSANFNGVNSKTVFGVRQQLKSRRYNSHHAIETGLKVSLFMTVVLVILS